MKFSAVVLVIMVIFGLLLVRDSSAQDDKASDGLIRLPMKRPFCNRYGGCSAAGRLGMGSRDRKRWGFQQAAPGPQLMDDSLAAFTPPDTEDAYVREAARQRLYEILRT